MTFETLLENSVFWLGISPLLRLNKHDLETSFWPFRVNNEHQKPSKNYLHLIIAEDIGSPKKYILYHSEMSYGGESSTASYGIWNYVLKLMPVPERNEATAMVGRTLLATNEVQKKLTCGLLWHHIDTFFLQRFVFCVESVARENRLAGDLVRTARSLCPTTSRKQQ